MKKHLFIICVFVLKLNFTSYSQQNKFGALSAVNCIPVTLDLTYSESLSNSSSWPNQLTCFNPNATFGGEVIFVLTAPCTNTIIFEVTFPATLSDCYVGWRNSTGTCLPDSFNCLNPISSVSINNQFKRTYQIQVIENNVYDIFITRDFFGGSPLNGVVTCKFKTPSIVANIYDITPDSISFSWPGIYNDVIVEYGPNGFTPGSGSTAGPLGTIISGISSPYKFFGLNNDSTYNFYFRSRCGNNFGVNTPVIRVRIPQPDSLIGVFTNCSNSALNVTVRGNYEYFPGSWIMNTCSSTCRMSSPEIIKKFTPDTSGYYILSKTSYLGKGTEEFTFYYKEATLGIDEKNWICMGPAGGITPFSQSFGPLNANTTYYILIKHAQQFDNNCAQVSGVHSNVKFKLDCPGVCPVYANLSIHLAYITSTSLNLFIGQGNTFGYYVIEYGPSGFTPGTDSLPGGGTVIIPSSTTWTNIPISGLQPETTYDFYLRQYCSSMNTFSSNSNSYSATTLPICSVNPVSISTNRPNNSVCPGQGIWLTQNGGVLSWGATFNWYKDSCGGTSVGVGNTIYVTPNTSKYYYVKAVDTCAANPCIAVYVTVNTVPQISILNPPISEICLGDTVELLATSTSGWIYDWRKNGLSLNAVSQPSYKTTTIGSYSVQATDSNTCSNTSQISKVKLICFPPQDPVEKISIDNSEDENYFNVIPNPGNGIFTCLFDSKQRNIKFSIYNSIGKKISSINGEIVPGKFIFDLSNFSSGLYYLVSESDVGINRQKIVLLTQ